MTELKVAVRTVVFARDSIRVSLNTKEYEPVLYYCKHMESKTNISSSAFDGSNFRIALSVISYHPTVVRQLKQVEREQKKKKVYR
jgi:hypothetical protein